jgi:hypothetical protein
MLLSDIYLIIFYTDIQCFSCTALAISIGIKLFKELPIKFPNTFTYNELILVSTIGSCGSFTFLIHIYKISKTNSQEVVIVEVNYFQKKLNYINSNI